MGGRTSALKRIKEKHPLYGDHPGCPELQQFGDPCDVVRLARALDETARAIQMIHRGRHPGEEDACAPCKFILEAERTLEEVAGD